MNRKTLFISSIAAIAVCSISNFALDIQTSKIADFTLNKTEAIASTREIHYQFDMTPYLSEPCTIHFNGETFPGTLVYCHEMPFSACAEGCST